MNAPCEAAADGAQRVGQRSAPVGDLAGDQVGDDLGVGVAGELDPVGLELGLQFGEVLDDAVVDDRDPAGRVGVRVRVAVVRRAVRRPAGVPDADRAPGSGSAPAASSLSRFSIRPAFLATCSSPSADHRDPGRVVAAVFQPAQALDHDVEGAPGADIADDAAHGSRSYGSRSAPARARCRIAHALGPCQPTAA